MISSSIMPFIHYMFKFFKMSGGMGNGGGGREGPGFRPRRASTKESFPNPTRLIMFGYRGARKGGLSMRRGYFAASPVPPWRIKARVSKNRRIARSENPVSRDSGQWPKIRGAVKNPRPQQR